MAAAAGAGGGAAVGAGAAEGWATAALGALCAASISALMIRSFGPLPRSPSSEMPACLAIRRAKGEAKMRPLPAWGCVSWPSAAGAAAGTACDAAMEGPEAEGLGELSSVPTEAAAGAALGVSPDGTASPASTRIAIGAFTCTPAVPSATRILPSTPSSTASTSMVALSVSISAITSPAVTVSPSFFSQRASVPSVMVGERAGIRMLVGIRRSSSRHRRPIAAAAAPAFPGWRHRAAARPAP